MRAGVVGVAPSASRGSVAFVSDRWDETWHRLLEWTNGSGPAERLAHQLVYAEGWRDVDPSHPLGGPDGGKDALATKDGKSWVVAVYFARGHKNFTETRDKLLADFAGVTANGAEAMVFVTNQELRLSERSDLKKAVDKPVEILHLEKITGILDRPDMHAVRKQFLRIDVLGGADASPATPPRTFGEIQDAAPEPPGRPGHRMVYDGVMLLRVAALPVPHIARFPTAGNPRDALVGAGGAAREMANHWPEQVSRLSYELGQGWQSNGPHSWGAGHTTSDVGALSNHPTAAAVFTTTNCAACVDRTWPTHIYDQYDRVVYSAAREPDVAAELIVALALIGTFYGGVSETRMSMSPSCCGPAGESSSPHNAPFPATGSVTRIRASFQDLTYLTVTSTAADSASTRCEPDIPSPRSCSDRG